MLRPPPGPVLNPARRTRRQDLNPRSEQCENYFNDNTTRADNEGDIQKANLDALIASTVLAFLSFGASVYVYKEIEAAKERRKGEVLEAKRLAKKNALLAQLELKRRAAERYSQFRPAREDLPYYTVLV